jgi:hypothetical protein
MWKENEFLCIKQGEFRAKLPMLKGENIPPQVHKETYDYELDFEPRMLAAVNRCGTVIEDDKADSPFKGILFDLSEEKTLRIAGFSQALLHSAQFDLPSTGGFRVALAYRCLPLFESLSGTLPTKILFDHKDHRVVCSSSESSMIVRCVEDTFPKGYVQFLGFHKIKQHQYPLTKTDKDGTILEETPRKVLKFRRDEFLSALNAAACVLGKEDNAVEMSVTNKLATGQYIVELIGLNRLNKARATSKVLAEATLASTLTIGIHQGKVREALRNFGTDVFEMHVSSPMDPFVLVEDGNNEIVSLSVPLRVA